MSSVRRLLGRWKGKTPFGPAVNQAPPSPGLNAPTAVSDTAKTDIHPLPPSQETRRRLEPEDERLVVENLPAVRVAARRIYRLLPDHVSFAKIYSAGVVGLVDAVDEFHATDPVRFADFVRRKIRDAILDRLPQLVWDAEEQRQKGVSIEAAIHHLRAELDRSPTEIEISHELHIDLAAYRRLLGELDDIEIGTLHSSRRKGSAEEDLIDLGDRPEVGSRLRTQRADLREKLKEAIRNLPERERLVLNLSYHEGLTLKQVGLVLDEPEPRVSQIHSSAMLYLRSQLSDSGYR
jgi:RNA polymerase sigma factor FliA